MDLGSGSFECSRLVRSCRTTACNLCWGNRLASRPFTDGDTLISFPSLWPDVATFTYLYRECDMGEALPDIVRLLLATRTYPQLEGLQQSHQLSWEQELEQDKCSLIHMVCALNCDQLLEAALTPLKQAQSNELLTRMDSQGEGGTCKYAKSHGSIQRQNLSYREKMLILKQIITMHR